MRFLILVILFGAPSSVLAELGSLAALSGGSQQERVQASLFIGNAKGGMLAPYPARVQPARVVTPAIVGTAPRSAVERLRNVIGRAESPRAGYDAVQHGARVKPRKPPTQMTLGEIYDWIAATRGQPHAIGRYQFIPATLRRVAARVGVGRDARFTPQLQDRLADVLLADAGLERFLDGRLSQQKFINNLAGIWAGLPTTNGRSKYHGYAGNRATISLAYFQSEISKMAPS